MRKEGGNKARRGAAAMKRSENKRWQLRRRVKEARDSAEVPTTPVVHLSNLAAPLRRARLELPKQRRSRLRRPLAIKGYFWPPTPVYSGQTVRLGNGAERAGWGPGRRYDRASRWSAIGHYASGSLGVLRVCSLLARRTICAAFLCHACQRQARLGRPGFRRTGS